MIEVGISDQWAESGDIGGHRLLDGCLLLCRPCRTNVAAAGGVWVPVGGTHRRRTELADSPGRLPLEPRASQRRQLHRMECIRGIVERLPGVEGIVYLSWFCILMLRLLIP